MCILFIAVNQHPDYPLIICANRDEFHQRPTQQMHWWPNSKKPLQILAGKDLEAGGTWLGIKENGKFAALTNYRQIPSNPQTQNKKLKSRGEVVVSALNDSEFSFSQLQSTVKDYQGFNLIFGDIHQLSCFDSVNQRFTPLATGYHSICNGALDDIWPKMASGEQQLEAYISRCANHEEAISHAQLLLMMQDEMTAPDHLLPKTGLPLEWERRLSAIFIKSAEYGTRSTCIITIDKQGATNVTEVSYDIMGNITTQQDFLLGR